MESSESFDAEDAACLEIVADHLAVAIENARLYNHGQQLAVLEERQRLARELHDSVTQHLFGMNLIAQSLSSAWRRDEVEAERRVTRMLELSRTALAEMRALLAELRPMSSAGPTAAEQPRAGIALVRQKGLVAALTLHIADLKADGWRIEFVPSAYCAQPLASEEEIFRIVQEALNNVIKHARAEQVIVELACRAGDLHVSVRDDGAGFDLQTTAGESAAGGLGLSTMCERALRLGGVLEVRSAPGNGTLVEARIPQAVLVPA